MNQIKISSKLFSLLFSVLITCFVVGFYVLAWQEPTALAPGNNVALPLNVSAQGQSKIGGLILNTGGAANGLIVAMGNVGIGTTTPGAKLEIAGQIKITGGSPGANKILTSDASGLASWQTPTGGGSQNLFLTIDVPLGTDPVADSSTDTLTLTAGSGITISGNSTTDTITIGSDTAYLQRRITGICAAGSSIRVIAVDGTVTCETDDVGTGGISGSGTLNYLSKWSGATNLTNSLIYDNGTNVGIGTTTPGAKLEIYNTADSLIKLSRSGTTFNYTFNLGTDGKLILNQSGNNRITLDTVGNVGVGTTTPGAKLEIAGQIKITGGSPGVGKVLTSDTNGFANWEYVTGPLNCSSTPIANTSDLDGWRATSMPSSCSSDDGCVIKQEIYDTSNSLLKVRLYDYMQDSDGMWWSSFQKGGSNKNGDSKETNIIKKYNDGKIKLTDDRNGVETSSSQWVVRDDSNNYYTKIYICSYQE